MTMRFAAAPSSTIPLHFVPSDTLESWREALPSAQANWLKVNGFAAKAGQVAVIPDDNGAILAAVAGAGGQKEAARQRFILASARAKLPEGTYRLVADLDADALAEAALGWLLAGYRFDRYAKSPAPKAEMVAPQGVDAPRLEAIAAGEALTRDLINIPASDMGPADLQKAAEDLAREYGAEISTIDGHALETSFPMIHTVGHGSDRAPRLIDIAWGDSGPVLALVGKGVCFDTGGLNIKPGASMGLMKKDMGGAATVLGLAKMIMSLNLPLRLRVLIPAVENSISGTAFRPQDILSSRKGLTVEINNTDAEGRLVLADALALADEDKPDLIVSMATLTGAARVAVGADIAPFYATADADAQAVAKGADKARDPVWRMPFWDPYETMIEPGIADLDNAPKGGMGGSITAALFLRRFVTDCPRYMHFDIYGWQPAAAPGRPKGGVGQGARALLQALPDLLSL